jgi:hypothetical protein
MTQLNLNDARCEALFASELQPSEHANAEAAAEAISGAVRHFGICGCASRMAQEFGDHPLAAAERMRWARQVVAKTTARPRAARLAARPSAAGQVRSSSAPRPPRTNRPAPGRAHQDRGQR